MLLKYESVAIAGAAIALHRLRRSAVSRCSIGHTGRHATSESRSGGSHPQHHPFIHGGGTFMTNLCRREAIRLLAFNMLLLILPATSWAQQLPPIAEQMAKTYGIDSFG